MKIYVDGEYYGKEEAKISVFDHGLLYGDGVFEGIRFYHGRVFRLTEHIDRLYDSAKAICLQDSAGKAGLSRPCSKRSARMSSTMAMCAWWSREEAAISG